jgi:hypothetical protein
MAHFYLRGTRLFFYDRQAPDLVEIGEKDERLFGQVVEEMQVGASEWQPCGEGAL